jgi:hypothetical protein
MRTEKQRLSWTIIVMALCGLIAGDAAAQATVIVEEGFPVREEQIRIHIANDDGSPVAGATVEVTYRPGSSVEQLEQIGTSAEDGAIYWVPAEAGIATINATWAGPDQSQITASTSVSVRFRSAPLGGIVIMIAAGVVLVIGSVFRIFNLLRAPQAP